MIEDHLDPAVEKILPELLRKSIWNGVILDSAPIIKRVYAKWRDGFIFLQEVVENRRRTPDFHKHPGNIRVYLKEGEYKMDVAYESDRVPETYETVEIRAGMKYALGQRDWHRIYPMTAETRSVVVVNDWHPPAISNIKVEQMTARELQQQVDIFRVYY